MNVNNKFCSTPSKLETIKVKKELLDCGVKNDIINSNNRILTPAVLSINDFHIESPKEDFETNRLRKISDHTCAAVNRKNMIHFLEDSLRYDTYY